MKKTKRTVCIVHYNTPELTEATILSLRKHGGEDYQVIIFDNSDARPFTSKMKGVKVIDNTKGKYIDFDKFLDQYPDRCNEIGVARNCNFGSAKHMRSVQELFKIVKKPFILMDSDILIKKNIDVFWDEQYAVVGHRLESQQGNRFGIGRLMPLLCFLNVPLLINHGAKYFDENRCYGLLPGGVFNRNNWYDTGASLLEDVMKTKPYLIGHHIDIRDYMIHYTSGSWASNDYEAHMTWLTRYQDLWIE